MYVYAIRDQAAGRVKVGFSENPLGRMATLPTPRSLEMLGAVAVEGREDERAIHAELSHLRLEGEWFADSPDEILQALARHGPVGIDDLPDPPIMFRAHITQAEWAEIRKMAIDAHVRPAQILTDLIRRGMASRKAEAAAA